MLRLLHLCYPSFKGIMLLTSQLLSSTVDFLHQQCIWKMCLPFVVSFTSRATWPIIMCTDSQECLNTKVLHVEWSNDGKSYLALFLRLIQAQIQGQEQTWVESSLYVICTRVEVRNWKDKNRYNRLFSREFCQLFFVTYLICFNRQLFHVVSLSIWKRRWACVWH